MIRYIYIQYHISRYCQIDLQSGWTNWHSNTNDLCVLTFKSNDRTWPTLQVLAPVSLIGGTAGSTDGRLLDFSGISILWYPRKLGSPLLIFQESSISLSDIRRGKCSQRLPGEALCSQSLENYCPILLMSFSCTPPLCCSSTLNKS